MTLKNTYFEPRYVLIQPLAKSAHERRLRERDMYSDTQIDATLGRADMYAEYNREHPGFFDMMINSGELPFNNTVHVDFHIFTTFKACEFDTSDVCGHLISPVSCWALCVYYMSIIFHILNDTQKITGSQKIKESTCTALFK